MNVIVVLLGVCLAASFPALTSGEPQSPNPPSPAAKDSLSNNDLDEGNHLDSSEEYGFSSSFSNLSSEKEKKCKNRKRGQNSGSDVDSDDSGKACNTL